jgi:colanic acid/amylovoran biosynthesis protein
VNILIINAHSSRNKGDAGILLSMIDSLRKNNPGCSIKIKSRFSEVDKKAYDVSVASCVANISIDPKTSRFLKLFSAFKLLRMLNSNQKGVDADYDWADVVVSCGGGFLLSHGFSAALMQHLVQIKVAFDYKKPVIIYSQSIGPFYNSQMQTLAKRVLDKVDKIYIREKISKEWLKKINCENKSLTIVPDSAFCMEAQQSELVDKMFNEIKENHNGPIVGLTARDWNFPEVNDTAFYRKKYINSIQETIKFIEEKYNGKVLLMPQVLGPNPFNDDRIISKEILDGINSKYAELINYDFHPRELKYFYSKMDMFIGTRMHSNIFALSSNIPTVAINYEHKTKGIMELLKLDDYVLDINDITAEGLIKKTENCWNKRDLLKQHLEENISNVIKEAETPAKYAGELKKA